MRKVNILILCALGMSSGLIVDSIKKNAEELEVEVDVRCSNSISFREHDYSAVDIILFAPQVRSQQSDIIKYVQGLGLNIPTMPIESREYGLIRGGIILAKALKILE